MLGRPALQTRGDDRASPVSSSPNKSRLTRLPPEASGTLWWILHLHTNSLLHLLHLFFSSSLLLSVRGLSSARLVPTCLQSNLRRLKAVTSFLMTVNTRDLKSSQCSHSGESLLLISMCCFVHKTSQMRSIARSDQKSRSKIVIIDGDDEKLSRLLPASSWRRLSWRRLWCRIAAVLSRRHC